MLIQVNLINANIDFSRDAKILLLVRYKAIIF